jgi:polyhydroxyalkanoate synthesis regulator phasin
MAHRVHVRKGVERVNGWIVALGMAALVAVGAGGAIAATKITPSSSSQAVIDDAAAQLGVQPAALSAALRKALLNRVDDAVRSGRLSKEQGDALKKRLGSAAVPLRLGFGLGVGPRAFGGPRPFAFRARPGGHLEGAATYLGLTEDELRSQLRSGKTLAEIAKAHGKSVDGLVNALVARAEKRLDQAVEDGRLTTERAKMLKDGLEKWTTALVNGTGLFGQRFEHGAPRLHHFGGFGFGHALAPRPKG